MSHSRKPARNDPGRFGGYLRDDSSASRGMRIASLGFEALAIY
jgi:hypothetical protein